MAQIDFINQLRALGYEVQDHGNGRVSFPYLAPLGKLTGHPVRVGYDVPPDFPLSPPPGPHVSPRIHQNKSGGEHPSGGIQDSPFGAEWQYWSRPMHHWAQTKRTARDVISHLNHLFDTQ